MATPVNKKLYNQVVVDAKKRFHKWPSAYASGWVVRRYKELGGEYRSDKRKEESSLDRWFKEKWVNVCESPYVACGRSEASMKDYPYCRPLKRMSDKTPKTVSQFTKKELKELCQAKKANPRKRVIH